MPTYVVTAPDGKKYRVTAPKGATQQEVMARVRSQGGGSGRQINRGGTNAKPKEDSFFQGVLEGVSKPITNAFDFVTGNIPSMVLPAGKALNAVAVPYVNKAIAKQKAEAPYKGSTAGRIVGGIVGTLPTMAVGGPVIQGALSGALLTEDPKDAKGVLRDVVIGAGASKLGDVVGRKIVAPAAKKAVGAVKSLAGKAPVDDIVNPLASLGDDAVTRAERLARAGVQNPTTGMVTRDPRAWYMEQEGLKRLGVGDDLLRQVQSVDDDLRSAAEKLMQGYSGDTAEEVGKTVQKTLATKDRELGDAVGALYKSVRAERGDAPVGALKAFREFIDSPDVVDNATFDSMRTSLMRRLERLGGSTSIGQAEELRKFVGSLGDAKDPAVRYMRKEMINALDDDVVNSVGDDAFKAAREAAKSRFEEFRKTFAGNIAEGNIAPERLVSRSLSQARPIDDVRSLVDSLVSGTDDQVARGGDALSQLRGQTLRDVIAPSLGPEGAPRAATLRRGFETNAPKLREILSPEDYARLEDLVGAVGDAKGAVPNSNVNYSNTGSTVANMFPDIKQGGSRLRDVLSAGAKLVGAGSLGTPGYVGAEIADRGLNMIGQRQAGQAISQQALLASSPSAAAQAIRDAEVRRIGEEVLRKYGSILGPAFAGPAAATAVPYANQKLEDLRNLAR